MFYLFCCLETRFLCCPEDLILPYDLFAEWKKKKVERNFSPRREKTAERPSVLGTLQKKYSWLVPAVRRKDVCFPRPQQILLQGKDLTLLPQMALVLCPLEFRDQKREAERGWYWAPRYE